MYDDTVAEWEVAMRDSLEEEDSLSNSPGKFKQ
jgi:hypothetical protein